VLETGDTVSIKTAKGLTVNADWLSVVVSSKARTAIRKELKDIKDEDALVLGHRMLDRHWIPLGILLKPWIGAPSKKY
jgi:Guanosine polyphosphate pyrophosphohydrolases/synthetases